MSDTSDFPVIVADDEPATRKLLEHQLQRAGQRVETYVDGRAALEAVTRTGSAVVLADWSMPEMDGIELCRAIRELQEMEALGNVYVILLTAHDSKERVVEGLEAGANDYLTKPYHQGELLARIHVGQRFLRLQEELLQRTVEYQKANTQLALLTREMEKLANTDALTGLSNRRCLLERFDETWELAERHGHPLSCIMLDIDKFKKVNDTYGHAAGDRVLVDIAAIIRDSGRRPDLCGRFGGEEFLVLCPHTPRDGAVLLAERIRKGVAACTVPCDNVPIAVSISCGVAERTGDTLRPEDLLKRADAMLYAAKEHGRDQTWVLAPGGGIQVVEVPAQTS